MQNLNPSIYKSSDLQEVFAQQKLRAVQLRSSSLSDRKAVVRKLKQWIESHQEEICEALYSDFRKSSVECIATEIMPVLSEIKYTLKNLKEWMRPTSAPIGLLFMGTSNKLYREPKGTTLLIAPWNYPFHLLVKPMVSALAAGCTLILKPSELTPNTAQLIKEMTLELFEKDYVYTFTGGSEVAINLQKLPFNHIFFTGSPQVGKQVMSAAAKHLSSVTLELGGKSPVIIDKTANLKTTAAAILYAKFLNAGQTCVAPDYTFVHQDVLEDFIKACQTTLDKMGKRNLIHSKDYCRIVNSKHYSRVYRILENALENGAKIEVGGSKDATQNYMEPTLLSGVNDDMLVMQEEIFGPVMPIIPFSHIESPINYINDKEKPLALYIFAQNQSLVKKINQETSAGATVLNDVVIQTIYKGMPFGGINNSGIGKTGGHYGFMEFTNLKPLIKNHFSATSLFHPPYTPWVKKLVHFATKYIS